MLHTRIREALANVNIYDPKNFQQVLNTLERVYWEMPTRPDISKIDPQMAIPMRLTEPS